MKKLFEIIVGIPSYNEEDNISFFTEIVDKGLVKYFPGKKCVIINVDNCSPDKTRRNFLSTSTKSEKIYISTPKNIKGKGNNFYNLFKSALKFQAEYIMVVDADLKSIFPEWVPFLINPVEKEGYDFVFPYYRRHYDDATITNFICYPLVYGLLGFNIRQPIGGDFAFNQKMIRYWLKRKWDSYIRNYGIDIFMSLNAIFGNFKICQADLGEKIHKPSRPKLNPMLDDVLMTAFTIIWQNESFWRKKKYKIKQPTFFTNFTKNKFVGGLEKTLGLPEKENFSKQEKSEVEIKNDFIDAKQWVEIVYSALKDFRRLKSLGIFFKDLYFKRINSFLKEIKYLSLEDSESLIQQQAEIFFKKRDQFLDNLD